MFFRQGQAALEYVMTYGWIALVILSVGLSLWYLGILTPGGTPTGATVGFSSVAPLESTCINGNTADVLRISILNAAGTQINNLNMTIGSNSVLCTNRLAIGDVVICNLTGIDCGAGLPGDRFEIDVQFEYTSKFGTLRKSSGTVRGTIE